MAKNDPNRRKKGTFSSAELSVSKKYIYPPGRKMMIFGGLAVSILLIGYFVADQIFFANSFISRGDLTSNHADFASDCTACHDPNNAVTDEKCQSCHEKFGDKLGIHSFETHYMYMEPDQSRISAASVKNKENEQTCYSCHPEHKGRLARITVVPDNKCLDCHDYGSFNSGHPEFQFARENIPDDSAIAFTHIRHTDFISKYLVEMGEKANLESTCLFCHVPQSNGLNFEPIDFDDNCSQCHLSAATETASYNVSTNNDDKPGVLTIDMIRRRVKPGTRWAYYTNPNEFKFVAGGKKVKKSPVYHKDPWILENLKEIRSILYPNLGIDGLLLTAENPQDIDKRKKQEKAIEILEGYVEQLQGRPEQEVQTDLKTIDSLLRVARKQLNSMSDVSFANSVTEPTLNPNLTPAQVKAYEKLADKLTTVSKKLCQECHILSGASLISYDGDQKILKRAKFDHRAHILEKQCLDCHTEIPITQEMSNGQVVEASRDVSKIQNIPGIDNCMECHTPSKASNNCVSCHNFHPIKNNRGNLKLYVD